MSGGQGCGSRVWGFKGHALTGFKFVGPDLRQVVGGNGKC